MNDEANSNLIPGPEYVDTPPDYDGPIELLNWGGHQIAAHGTARLNKEFLDEIKQRINDGRAVICILTGKAGEGKSWFAETLAKLFDKNFMVLDVNEEIEIDGELRIPKSGEDPSQIVFDRQNFLFLIGGNTPLKMGQTMMLDEAQYAAGARNWYEEVQKDLMDAMESVRSKGFIILIVALHLELLDKIIRKFVLTYMFHIEDRGKAIVYKLGTNRFRSELRPRRLGKIILAMPDYAYCANNECLKSCPYLNGEPRCMTDRAIYERRKHAFLSQRYTDTQRKEEAKQSKERPPNKELSELAYKHRDLLNFGRQGRVSTESMVYLYEEVLNIRVPESSCRIIRERLEKEHPEMLRRKLAE